MLNNKNGVGKIWVIIIAFLCSFSFMCLFLSSSVAEYDKTTAQKKINDILQNNSINIEDQEEVESFLLEFGEDQVFEITKDGRMKDTGYTYSSLYNFALKGEKDNTKSKNEKTTPTITVDTETSEIKKEDVSSSSSSVTNNPNSTNDYKERIKKLIFNNTSIDITNEQGKSQFLEQYGNKSVSEVIPIDSKDGLTVNNFYNLVFNYNSNIDELNKTLNTLGNYISDFNKIATNDDQKYAFAVFYEKHKNELPLDMSGFVKYVTDAKKDSTDLLSTYEKALENYNKGKQSTEDKTQTTKKVEATSKGQDTSTTQTLADQIKAKGITQNQILETFENNESVYNLLKSNSDKALVQIKELNDINLNINGVTATATQFAAYLTQIGVYTKKGAKLSGKDVTGSDILQSIEIVNTINDNQVGKDWVAPKVTVDDGNGNTFEAATQIKNSNTNINVQNQVYDWHNKAVKGEGNHPSMPDYLKSSQIKELQNKIDNLSNNGQISNSNIANLENQLNSLLAERKQTFDSFNNMYYELVRNTIPEGKTSQYDSPNYVAVQTGGILTGNVNMFTTYHNVNVPAGTRLVRGDMNQNVYSTQGEVNVTWTMKITDNNGKVIGFGGVIGDTEVFIPIDEADRIGLTPELEGLPTGDPDEPTSKPEDPPTEEEDGEHEKIWYTVETTVYSDHAPNISMNVSNPIYDISASIPTSENLEYFVSAKAALHDITVRKITFYGYAYDVKLTATCSYPDKDEKGKEIRSSYTYTHEEAWQSEDVSVPSFYDVTISVIDPVTGSVMTHTCEEFPEYILSSNVSLPGLDKVSSQTLEIQIQSAGINGHYDKDCGGADSYGEAVEAAKGADVESLKNQIRSALKNAMESSVKGSVNYKYLQLEVKTRSCNYVAPHAPNVSGTQTILIPSDYANGYYAPSGVVNYELTSHDSTINRVYVHSPVVNNAYLTMDTFDNQKIAQENIEYTQLDGSFTITIPDYGTHKDYPGYNSRAYNSKQGVNSANTTWGTIRDFKIPFDVYVFDKDYENNKKKYFLKANTWLSEDSNISYNDVAKILYSNSSSDKQGYVSFKVTVPVWVKEGLYTWDSNKGSRVGDSIYVRVAAENVLNSSGARKALLTEDSRIVIEEVQGKSYNSGTLFNGEGTDKYVAIKKIPIEVIGKIYDLRINATNDDGWTDVYSASHNKDYIDAAELVFGQKGQNKASSYSYAPKLGYTFSYTFKTKGRKSNNVDAKIDANGGFFFVPKNAGQSTEVEKVTLFYKKSGTNVYIPVLDNSQIQVNLNANYMEIPQEEKTNSALIYPLEYGNKDMFDTALPYNYNTPVMLKNTLINGNIYKYNLPHNLRFTYDNFAEYLSQNGDASIKQIAIKYTGTVNGVDVSNNGVEYQYKGNVIQGKYGINNTKASIIDNVKNMSEAMKTYGFNKGDSRGVETGEQYILGSVGHWHVGFRLPTSTIAINSKDVDDILKTLGNGSIADKANDIVLRAQQQGKVKTNGYIGVKFTLVTNYKTGSNNFAYLKYNGPEVTNIITGEDYGLIYYDDEELYHTFEGTPIKFSIGPIGNSNTAKLPGGSTVTKDINFSIGKIKQNITLPNGRKQDVPAWSIALFETDLNAGADVKAGQDY